MTFDPNAYLASSSGEFDPDAYLGKSPAPPDTLGGYAAKYLSPLIPNGIKDAAARHLPVLQALLKNIPFPNILGGNKATDIVNAPANYVRGKVQPAIDAVTSPGIVRATANTAANYGASLLTPAGALLTRLPGGSSKVGGMEVGPAASAAEKMGVPLTPAELTQSKPLSLVESTLEKYPMTAGRMQNFKDARAATIQGEVSKIQEGAGQALPDYLAGKNAQEAIGSAKVATQKGRDQAFAYLNEIVPPESIVRTNNLGQAAEKLLAQRQQLPKSFQDSPSLNTLTEVSKIREQGLSWEGAKALREELNSRLMNNADSSTYQVYKVLKSGLDKDIGEFAASSGAGVKDAYDLANAMHGNFKNIYFKNKNIQRLVNANPERVMDILIRPGNVQEIKDFRNAAGTGAMDNLRGTLISRLFEGRPNQTAADALESNLRKYGDETISEALGKSNLNDLKSLAQVNSVTKTAGKMAGNPSGTAQVLITYRAGEYWMSHPINGTVVGIPAYVLARAYLSPITRSIIREGLTTPITGTNAAKLFGRLANVLNVDKDRRGANYSKPIQSLGSATT